MTAMAAQTPESKSPSRRALLGGAPGGLRRLIATLLAPLFAASLLLGSASGVAASDPPTYFVDVFYCTVADEDGNQIDPDSIPAGSDIVLWEGWLAKTRGETTGFVNNVTWVLTVNGQPVDITPGLTGVIPFGPYWADLFFYDAGILGSGQSMATHYDNVLKSAAYDGFIHWMRGSVYGGGVDCEVSAAA